MDASFRDWQELPPHILELLVFKVDSFSDYLRVSRVCPQWRHVALEDDVDYKDNLDLLKATFSKLPLLVFKTDKNYKSWKLHSISDGKTYTCKLPVPYKNRFAGSSMGCLVYVEEILVITLANPYNNSCISLPVFKDPFEVFQIWSRVYVDFHITKVIILSDPLVCPDSFVVVVIYNVDYNIAFFRAGESSWNFLNSTDVAVDDIINYKGKLYGLALEWKTFKTIISSYCYDAMVSDCIYLVESQDVQLFMVERLWYDRDCEIVNEEYCVHEKNSSNQDSYVADNEYLSDGESSNSEFHSDREGTTMVKLPRTLKFKVFKMSNLIEEGPATWVELHDIGQQALFLGLQK